MSSPAPLAADDRWNPYPDPPPIETTIALLDLGILERLAFATTAKPGAPVHVLRFWPEDHVPDGMPLAELGPHDIRADILLFPSGVLGWSMCGLRLKLFTPVLPEYAGGFPDEALCGKCLDRLGPTHRLLAYQRRAEPMDGKKTQQLPPPTGPFRHRHGGRTVRVAIPWTGDWDTFVAHAALIGLDITGFAPGLNHTLCIPGHLHGQEEYLSLSRDGWLGYVEGSEVIWTWAGEYFRYDYFGGPKPQSLIQQEREAAARFTHPLRQGKYRPGEAGAGAYERLAALGSSPQFRHWLYGQPGGSG